MLDQWMFPKLIQLGSANAANVISACDPPKLQYYDNSSMISSEADFGWLVRWPLRREWACAFSLYRVVCFSR